MSCCPICKSSDTEPYISRDLVPVFQNVLYPNQQDAQAARVGSLRLMLCKDCYFIFNAAFDPAAATYDDTYENYQGLSGVFTDHLKDVAQAILKRHKDASLKIVEVGCGQGDFLKIVLDSHANANDRAVGFDPSCRASNEASKPISYVKKYYDPSTAIEAGFIPGVVVSRHVIEHVKDPVAFLQTIGAAVGRENTCDIYIETPRLEWILEHHAFWDFFYEHSCYYSEHALAQVCHRAGLTLKSIVPLFGGQYQLLHAVVGPDAQKQTSGPELSDSTSPDLAAYIDQYDLMVARWHDRVRQDAIEGPVMVWGAGAKGMTFTHLIDPTHEYIEALIDVNPRKQDLYSPITAHPVMAPEYLRSHMPKTIILMNPLYEREVQETLKDMCINTNLVVL